MFLIFKRTILHSLTSFVVMVSIVVGTIGMQLQTAYAAALSSLSDSQSSLKISTLSDHTIQFVTPTGVAAGQTITITFPASYTMGTFSVNNVDLATSTSATCSGFVDAPLNTTPSGLTWGVAQSGQTITITSGTATIPANRCVQIEIGANATSGATGVSQITNPGSANVYTIDIAGTFGDNGSTTQNIITNDTVTISATVAQSLSFAISTTTLYFGTLGTGGAKFASSTNPAGESSEVIAHTLAVSTNAASGYTIAVRGQTLTSQQNASNTINFIGPTAASSTIGTEQFGIRATVSGGSGASIDGTYSLASSYGYDATATTSAVFATGNSATLTSTYSLRYVANISSLTEAGTYVANLVYVATANY